METRAMRKKRVRGGSYDGGEPASKRKTTAAEPSIKKGEAILYNEDKHGPIPVQELDPDIQEIFKELETEIKSLEARTVDSEIIEITEYYCYKTAETLAKETIQRVMDGVKQHPVLARVVNE